VIGPRSAAGIFNAKAQGRKGAKKQEEASPFFVFLRLCVFAPLR
jgi:hypothetical protein